MLEMMFVAHILDFGNNNIFQSLNYKGHNIRSYIFCTVQYISAEGFLIIVPNAKGAYVAYILKFGNNNIMVLIFRVSSN